MWAPPPAGGAGETRSRDAVITAAGGNQPKLSEVRLTVGAKRKAAEVFRMPNFITEDPSFTLAVREGTDALLAARAGVKDTRDVAQAAEIAGVGDSYGMLSGPERFRALQAAALSVSAGAPKKVGRRAAFIKFMQESFPFMNPLPVTLEGVVVYCADHVLVQGNKSAYLGDVVSQLRVATTALGEWALSEEDEEHLRHANRFIQRSFPSAVAPQPTLSVEQLTKMYKFLDTLDCVEARLCSALVKMMVGMQARATELLDGALWAGDLVFHAYGVLVSSVLNKCRKATLDPVARVAPRLPEHFKLHDPMESLHKHLFLDAGWARGAPAHNKPVFLQPVRAASGAWELSDAPLTAEAGRSIIIKYLNLAGVAHDPKMFSFSMHFGRAAGFNMLHNTLMVERNLCAAAGGWRHGDVLDKHYHVRSPLELAVNIRMAFTRTAELLRWKLV